MMADFNFSNSTHINSNHPKMDLNLYSLPKTNFLPELISSA
jgi:hypothetical protein